MASAALFEQITSGGVKSLFERVTDSLVDSAEVRPSITIWHKTCLYLFESNKGHWHKLLWKQPKDNTGLWHHIVFKAVSTWTSPWKAFVFSPSHLALYQEYLHLNRSIVNDSMGISLYSRPVGGTENTETEEEMDELHVLVCRGNRTVQNENWWK